jgi:hypothetical protein
MCDILFGMQIGVQYLVCTLVCNIWDAHWCAIFGMQTFEIEMVCTDVLVIQSVMCGVYYLGVA